MLKAPRGTGDILPVDAERWHYLEETFKKLCYNYGYQEIRTPIIEHTELFQRGVGETTDVVEKEMYIFTDRGGRSLSLRPEGTAPVARAYIQHKMFNLPQPVKMYYYGPMFRYDRPQAGRYRQFYQLGVEAFGSWDPSIDSEIIKLTSNFFAEIGLVHLDLEINSVGCPECRPKYREKLISYFSSYKRDLCSDCSRRLEHNPLRVLDCKNENCSELSQNAPIIKDNLCNNCHEHFQGLLKGLDMFNVDYLINPGMVRGLDYYTKTAFEFVDKNLKTQGSLGGGGRYDGLVEVCGGPATPGVGMALGVERIILAMQSNNIDKGLTEENGIYLAASDKSLDELRWNLIFRLRDDGYRVDTDFSGRSLRSQLKFANKKNFRWVLILGPEEKEKGTVIVKNMEAGSQEEVLMEEIPSYLSSSFRDSSKED